MIPVDAPVSVFINHEAGLSLSLVDGYVVGMNLTFERLGD
jgi:hypothetical protein